MPFPKKVKEQLLDKIFKYCKYEYYIELYEYLIFLLN